MSEASEHEFSFGEVAEALMELVNEGELAMGIDPETGQFVFWVNEDRRAEVSAEAVAVV